MGRALHDHPAARHAGCTACLAELPEGRGEAVRPQGAVLAEVVQKGPPQKEAAPDHDVGDLERAEPEGRDGSAQPDRIRAAPGPVAQRDQRRRSARECDDRGPARPLAHRPGGVDVPRSRVRPARRQKGLRRRRDSRICGLRPRHAPSGAPREAGHEPPRRQERAPLDSGDRLGLAAEEFGQRWEHAGPAGSEAHAEAVLRGAEEEAQALAHREGAVVQLPRPSWGRSPCARPSSGRGSSPRRWRRW